MWLCDQLISMMNSIMNPEFKLCFCFLLVLSKESLCSLAVSVCPDVLFMLILAQISGWMMINVVAILAYLIIHINILIFAVGSQIFIELSPILSPQHTHPLTLCVAKVLHSFSPFHPQLTIFSIFTRSFWLGLPQCQSSGQRGQWSVWTVNILRQPTLDADIIMERSIIHDGPGRQTVTRKQL